MSANWQALAIQEAMTQGVDSNIVLATVDAETSGRNQLGDYGNALGYGQVWPKWHNDAFVYAANRYRVQWPSTLAEQQQVVLSNDGLSMAATVYVIKQDWNASGKDFRQFSLMYVGQGIPDADYQRRYNIWLKYQGGNYPAFNGGGLSGGGSFGGSGSTDLNGITIDPTNYGVVANSQQLGNILYGRRYRIIVSNAQGVALDVSQLRCTFKIQKTILQQPNFSEIVIYNLSPDTENAIIQEGNRIILEAGYVGEQYGLIFDGDIIQPIRDKENNVNYRLSLYSLDGDRFLATGFVGFSIQKGQTARSMVDNIVNRAKVPSQLGAVSDSLDPTELSRGKVVFGLAKDYLRQIGQSNNAAFNIEDGKVNIIRATDLPEGQIIDLSPDSGLIGSPTQTEYGISFKCLLNPKIKINTLVHIDNRLIRAQQIQLGANQLVRNLDNDGIYRVIGITHTGDTRGNNWYTECTTVSQAGAIISMMPTSGSNPY